MYSIVLGVFAFAEVDALAGVFGGDVDALAGAWPCPGVGESGTVIGTAPWPFGGDALVGTGPCLGVGESGTRIGTWPCVSVAPLDAA